MTFHSALVPPYVRKTKSLEAALPWLYLKGISSGEWERTGSAGGAGSEGSVSEHGVAAEAGGPNFYRPPGAMNESLDKPVGLCVGRWRLRPAGGECETVCTCGVLAINNRQAREVLRQDGHLGMWDFGSRLRKLPRPSSIEHWQTTFGQCARTGAGYADSISREGDHRSEIQRRNRSNKRQSGRRLIQPLNTDLRDSNPRPPRQLLHALPYLLHPCSRGSKTGSRSFQRRRTLRSRPSASTATGGVFTSCTRCSASRSLIT